MESDEKVTMMITVLTDRVRFEGGDDAEDIVGGLLILHAGGAATAGAPIAGQTAGLATQLGEHFACNPPSLSNSHIL